MLRALSNKEMRLLKKQLTNLGFSGKRLFVLELDDKKLYFDENKNLICFEFANKFLVPSLKQEVNLPSVVVDMKAVAYITNGADVMRPGIVDLDSFDVNNLVNIVDEKFHKTIAIGLSLFNSEEIKKMDKGKVVKNLHYVGDKIYNLKI